jgi:hypothetical protein
MTRALHPLLATLPLLGGCVATWTLDDGVLGGTTAPCAQELSFYRDADGDGYGDPQGFVRKACAAEAGEAANAGDCDDTDPAIHPDAVELCNGVDDDCDALPEDEDATDATAWYLDGDGDGYGDDTAPVTACEPPNGAYQADGGDCDDTDPDIHPDAVESCDGVDEDCDGEVDEDAGIGPTWYRDGDGDGYGVDDDTVVSCDAPEGYAADGGDCLDEDASGYLGADVYPGSTTVEVPGDGVDSDCDGRDVCTDLDCNGLPDIVVPNHSRSTGAMSVSSIVHFDGGAGDSLALSYLGVRAMAAEDLDGDGYVDLVAACERSDSSVDVDSVVRWGGAPDDATRFQQTDLLSTTAARDVAVADLDGDGLMDLVFANHGSAAGVLDVDSVIYWGTLSGYDAGRATFLETHGATDVLIDDIDGDGGLDIVFCNQGTGPEAEGIWSTDSYIYWNRGSGTRFNESTRAALPTIGCASVRAADANADGVLDLFFAGWHDGEGSETSSMAYLSVRGETRHESSVGEPLAGSYTWQVLPGDVDGDGITDLVTLPWQDPISGSWETPGRAMYGSDASYPEWGTANSRVLPSTGSGNGALADLNLDGIDDVIVPGYVDDNGITDPGTTLWFGREGGLSTSATYGLDTPNARSVAAGDLDRDGLLDLVFLGSADQDGAAAVSVYLAAELPSPTSGYDSVPNRSLGGVHVTKAPPLLVGAAD